MSNKQAIEIIKKMINEIRCFDPSNDDYLQVEYERWLHDWEYQALVNVLDIIQSLPDTDEWISINDRLPDEWNTFIYLTWNWKVMVCSNRNLDDWFIRKYAVTHWVYPIPSLIT